MRWTSRTPKNGDKRIKRKFLFIPVCLDGEWRWLEWAVIVQRFDANEYAWFMGGEWMNEAWVEEIAY